MDDQVTRATLRAIRRILRAAEHSTRRLAAATGLTPSQLLVLREIERQPGTTPGAIAAALQFSQATVTHIVDRLEAANLVSRRRGERDRRQILLEPTPAGLHALDTAPDLLQQEFQTSFDALPMWERAMILAALEKVAHLFDASQIDAAPLIDVGAIDRD